jgi:hypothetical protein
MSPRAARWLPGVQLAAFWPLGVWYFRRVLDSGEDPWGLLALLSAGLLLGRGVAPRAPTLESDRNCVSLWPAAVFTLLYAAAYPVLPNLLCAVLAATALALLLSACVLRRVLHPGLLGLLWLALPVLPSIEYYAGFPLRVLVTHGAALWLRLAGWAVRPEQAVLNWEGLQVAVDAPCAGLRMMWAGAWLTLTLICLRRLSFRRAVLAAVRALVWILAAPGGRSDRIRLCRGRDRHDDPRPGGRGCGVHDSTADRPANRFAGLVGLRVSGCGFAPSGRQTGFDAARSPAGLAGGDGGAAACSSGSRRGGAGVCPRLSRAHGQIHGWNAGGDFPERARGHPPAASAGNLSSRPGLSDPARAPAHRRAGTPLGMLAGHPCLSPCAGAHLHHRRARRLLARCFRLVLVRHARQDPAALDGGQRGGAGGMTSASRPGELR